MITVSGRKQTHRVDSIVLVNLICAFIATNPYMIWPTYCNGFFSGVGTISTISLVYLLSILCNALYLIKNNDKIQINKAKAIVLLLVLSLYMKGVKANEVISVVSFLPFIYTTSFILLPTSKQAKAFIAFMKLFTISLVPTLLYIALTTIGISLPYSILTPNHPQKVANGWYYRKYLMSIYLVDTRTMTGVFSALYDERGVIGTFAAFFLVSQSYRLKGRLQNIILLVSGILSQSIAFILLSLMYLSLRQIVKKNWKSAVVLLLIICAYFVFISINFQNVAIQTIQNRITFSNSSLVGDNRLSRAAKAEYADFWSSDFETIIFGNYDGAFTNKYYETSSYFNLIYDYGLLGFIAIIMWLVFLLKVSGALKDNKQRVIFLIVFLLSIFQRPFIFSGDYILIYIGGLSYLYELQNNDGVIKI